LNDQLPSKAHKIWRQLYCRQPTVQLLARQGDLRLRGIQRGLPA